MFSARARQARAGILPTVDAGGADLIAARCASLKTTQSPDACASPAPREA
jgi:hypothetical protein